MTNPYEIRRGHVFNLATHELPKYVQVYFEKDVEAPLIAYVDYHKLLNLELLIKPEEVKVIHCVVVITSNISDFKAIACGVVVQSSGATQNGINLIKQSFLVNVTEVFDIMLLVHFPAMSSVCRCKCGRKEHIFLIYLCGITTLKYFGSVLFHIIETVYRLQKVDAVGSTSDPVKHKEVGITRKKYCGCCYY